MESVKFDGNTNVVPSEYLRGQVTSLRTFLRWLSAEDEYLERSTQERSVRKSFCVVPEEHEF